MRPWLAASILLLSMTPALARAATPAGRSSSPVRKRPARRAAQPPQVAVFETVLGRIVIRLNDKDAPKTVANFKRLVQRGFFDSTYFHRAIPGFLIQAGDPNTKNDALADDGRGGPGYSLPAENRLPHLRGSVSTVAENDSLVNGSQFIITASAQPSLDAAGFAIFGDVISPMEVVERIEALGDDPNCPRTSSGPNPAWHALILRATLEPLAQWQKVPVDSATSP